MRLLLGVELPDRERHEDLGQGPQEAVGAMLEHLEHRHGGAGSLLLRHGLTRAELDRLVELLTEPAAG